MKPLLRIGDQFVNIDNVCTVKDNIEESDSLVLLFRPLAEDVDNIDTARIMWAAVEFHGDEARALLDFLNRNSEHIT